MKGKQMRGETGDTKAAAEEKGGWMGEQGKEGSRLRGSDGCGGRCSPVIAVKNLITRLDESH